MKVLVSVSSKHGATAEMAQRIGETLAAAGLDSDVRPPETVSSVAAYDAVIVGSAVYAGRWLGPARSLIERESAVLKTRPVWLFSSGPLGDPPKPNDPPEEVGRLGDATQAIEHRVFAGKSDGTSLGFVERAIFAVVRAPAGDYRPWEDITEWAAQIARTLNEPAAVETA
jgi:menaquinone-dependent protoporphyrinogen oxidase